MIQKWSLQDLFDESIKIYPLLYATLFTFSVTFETLFLLQCVFWYICSMNLPWNSCTYSYSLGVYLIYSRQISIIFQTFCFLYFKSIFIKTITSFLFGDVIHKPHSFISCKMVTSIFTGVLYVQYTQQIKLSFVTNHISINISSKNITLKNKWISLGIYTSTYTGQTHLRPKNRLVNHGLSLTLWRHDVKLKVLPTV